MGQLDRHDSGKELMMRQIDDFLMITTNRDDATRFLRAMLEGVEAYGCTISRGKTKTNFEPRRRCVCVCVCVCVCACVFVCQPESVLVVSQHHNHPSKHPRIHASWHALTITTYAS